MAGFGLFVSQSPDADTKAISDFAKIVESDVTPSVLDVDQIRVSEADHCCKTAQRDTLSFALLANPLPKFLFSFVCAHASADYFAKLLEWY